MYGGYREAERINALARDRALKRVCTLRRKMCRGLNLSGNQGSGQYGRVNELYFAKQLIALLNGRTAQRRLNRDAAYDGERHGK